jgi:hypothetical protein
MILPPRSGAAGVEACDGICLREMGPVPGVTTTQTSVGTASNSAILTVGALAPAAISKAFNPTSIASGGTSVVTLTVSNSNASALTGGA